MRKVMCRMTRPETRRRMGRAGIALLFTLIFCLGLWTVDDYGRFGLALALQQFVTTFTLGGLVETVIGHLDDADVQLEAAVAARLGKGARQIERHFPALPICAPPPPVLGDPRAHLLVQRLGSGDIQPGRRACVRQLFGIAALAGASAADDECQPWHKGCGHKS